MVTRLPIVLNNGYTEECQSTDELLIDTLPLGSITSEPTGFPNRTDTSLSWSDASPDRTFTITGTNFKVYVSGKEFIKSTTTLQIPAVVDLYYIYYNSSGTLVSSTTMPDLSQNAIVATVYWNGANGLLGEERHGTTMDAATHGFLHNTVGARYSTGLTGVFTNPAAISVGAGSFYDEDILHTIGSTQTSCRVLYRSGSAFTFTAVQNSYVHQVANVLQYDNAGTLTDVTNNRYVAYWVFVTNNATTPIAVLMGQREDTTLTSARNNNTYESLSLTGLPFKEMKLLYRVIVQRSGTSEVYVETADLRAVSNLPAGTYVATDHNVLTNRDVLGSHPASAITADTTSFDKVLSASDLNVQVALGTLDEHYHVHYCGILEIPTYTDNGDGSVTIGNNGVYALYSSTTALSDVRRYALDGGTFTLVDGKINFIYVEYNGGTPRVYSTITRTDIADQKLITAYPIYTLHRSGTTIRQLSWGTSGVGAVEKLTLRMINDERFGVEPNGLRISETGTQQFAVTAGAVWYGTNRTVIDAYTCVTDALYGWEYNGTSWSYSAMTTYDNTYYQGATGLVELTSNRFAVNWVYRTVINGVKQCCIVRGGGDYKLAEAVASSVPSNIPDQLNYFGVLVGRIIVQKGATTATQVDSAFTTTFSMGSTTIHNDLSGLDGGTLGEYYHLTSAQHVGLTGIGAGQMVYASAAGVAASDTYLTYDSTNHTVGIGDAAASATSVLTLRKIYGGTATGYAVNGYIMSESASTATPLIGLGYAVRTNHTSGTQSAWNVAIQGTVYAGFGATTTDMASFEAKAWVLPNSYLDNRYGLVIRDTLEDMFASVGTQYGIYAENLDSASTNWFIYSLGGASYHAGTMKFGTTIGVGADPVSYIGIRANLSLTDPASSPSTLNLGGTITMTNDVSRSGYGIQGALVHAGTSGKTTTGTWAGIYGQISTATAGTLVTATGVKADVVVGAGTQVNYALGCHPTLTLNGTVGNLAAAFYSTLASATKVYNFYISGTAPGYFNHEMRIATTTACDSGYYLRIAGGIEPNADDTSKLGTASLRWSEVHVSDFVSMREEARLYYDSEFRGLAIKLTSGAAVAKYDIVQADTAGDDRAIQAVADADMPIGVAMNTTTGAGETLWVMVYGVATVDFKSTTTPTRGYVAYCSSEAGKADCASTVPAAATHFKEIGHVLNNASAGTTARVILHYN